MAAAALLATRGALPDQRQVRLRGRGGERPRSTSTAWLDRQPRPAGGRCRDHQRHGLLRRQHPGHHGQPARPDVRPDRRRRLGRGPALGRLRRRRPEPGQRAGPDHRRAQGPGRPDPHPRVLRRRRRAHRRGARRDRGAAVRRGGLPPRQSASRDSSARSATRPSSDAATRPTLDVNGLWGGFQGDGTKTIIPAHAHAKVSCRLVAAQDPADIFEQFRDFVVEIAPPGVTVTVQDLGGGRPSLTPIDHPVTQAAARALEATFGRAPVFTREGGSIPVVGQLRVDPRPAGRAPRVHPAPRERPRPQRMDVDLANYEGAIRAIVANIRRDRQHPDDRAVGLARSGWVIGPVRVLRYVGRTAAASPCLRGGTHRVTTRLTPPPPRRLRAAGASTPTTAAWRPRSALDVLVDLNERVTTGHLAEYQPVPLGLHAARQDHRHRACVPASCC